MKSMDLSESPQVSSDNKFIGTSQNPTSPQAVNLHPSYRPDGIQKKGIFLIIIISILILCTLFFIYILKIIPGIYTFNKRQISIPIGLENSGFDEAGVIYDVWATIKEVNSEENETKIKIAHQTQGAPNEIVIKEKGTTIWYADKSLNLQLANISDLKVNQNVVIGLLYSLKSKNFETNQWRTSYILIHSSTQESKKP